MTTGESKGRFFYKTNRFESIRINGIDSNRELECSTRNWDSQCLLLLHFFIYFILFRFILFHFKQDNRQTKAHRTGR